MLLEFLVCLHSSLFSSIALSHWLLQFFIPLCLLNADHFDLLALMSRSVFVSVLVFSYWVWLLGKWWWRWWQTHMNKTLCVRAGSNFSSSTMSFHRSFFVLFSFYIQMQISAPPAFISFCSIDSVITVFRYLVCHFFLLVFHFLFMRPTVFFCSTLVCTLNVSLSFCWWQQKRRRKTAVVATKLKVSEHTLKLK